MLTTHHARPGRLTTSQPGRGKLPRTMEQNRRITLRFAWYDLWVGAFIDQAKRRLYVCPLPCILITIQLP